MADRDNTSGEGVVIQQICDHALQPPGLQQGNVEEFAGLPAFDNALTHRMHQSLDGGNRGLQLMGHPGQHHCPGLLELLQLARHLLEGEQQLVNLALLGLRLQDDVIFPPADLRGRGGYPLNRLGQLDGQEIDGQPA
ncbi:hypothetical protein D3C74_381520 [compost metagenome]